MRISRRSKNIAVVKIAFLLSVQFNIAVQAKVDDAHLMAQTKFGDLNERPPIRMRGAQNRVPNINSQALSTDDIHNVAVQKCVPVKGKKFIWNFENEALIDITRQVGDLLCKTIVINDSISKNLKLTIIGNSELTPQDAWDVLQAALAAKGLALVQQGKTWTVIKRSESKSYASPMYFSGKNLRSSEAMGTLFYKIKNTSQDSLQSIARRLVSKDGMAENVGDQFVIVVDSKSNLKRISTIFESIDVEDAANRIHTVNLKHVDAKVVEKQLRELFDVGAGHRPRRRRGMPDNNKSSLNIDKIISDDMANRLFFIADQDSAERLMEFISLIDQPINEQAKGKIHVWKVRNGDAKDIAETLNSVVQQTRSSRFGRRREEDTNSLFEGEVKITAHESTNSLVTVASVNDYRSLLQTINLLDVKKAQVYIDAAILDIQVQDKTEVGVNLFGGVDPGTMGLPGQVGIAANPGGRSMAEGIKTAVMSSASGAGVADVGGMGALAVLSNFLSGGVLGLVGPSIGNTKIPSFGAVLQAVSQNSNVDVLSTPYLLTTDNKEGIMSVGEKIPAIRGISSVGGAGSNLGQPVQNVQYEDVKLTFKITPHVGADNNVTLDIDQEVNELGAAEQILNSKQYRIRTKHAKTTLVLKDQQTGVIGGLISHRTSTIDNKVPFLGDIPILGWLFKKRAKDNDRHSLLLVITPYVIHTDGDYSKLVDRKLKERKEFANMYYGGKIKNYNKYVDYDKKPGPMSSLVLSLDKEMNKIENGGKGEQEGVQVPDIKVDDNKSSVDKLINEFESREHMGPPKDSQMIK